MCLTGLCYRHKDGKFKVSGQLSHITDPDPESDVPIDYSSNRQVVPCDPSQNHEVSELQPMEHTSPGPHLLGLNRPLLRKRQSKLDISR